VPEPVRVGDVLRGLPGLTERLAEHLAEARLLAAWPAIAGPGAARSRAEAVEHGILQVAVESSGWLHRLTLEEARLTARCREIAAIRGIRFRLAARAADGSACGPAMPPPEGEVHR
jgi:hypothetical protein